MDLEEEVKKMGVSEEEIAKSQESYLKECDHKFHYIAKSLATYDQVNPSLHHTSWNCAMVNIVMCNCRMIIESLKDPSVEKKIWVLEAVKKATTDILEKGFDVVKKEIWEKGNE
jgi:hypothetical protein